jgi:PKD repeat protein
MRYLLMVFLSVSLSVWGIAQDCGYEVNLGPDTTLCEGDTLILTYAAPSDTLMLLWSTGSMDTTIEVTSSGTYYLTVFSDSCSVTDTIIVGFLPIPGIDLSVDPVCYGNPSSFIYSITALANASITWNMGDGVIYSQLPVFDTLEHFYPDWDEYEMVLLVDNGFGCSNSDTVTAIVNYQPSAGFEAPSVCFNDESTVAFTGQCLTNDCQYLVDFGDGSAPLETGDPEGISYLYANPQTYDITLVVSTLFCTDTLSAAHTVLPLPDPGFSGLDENYCEGDPPANLIATTPGGQFSGINVIQQSDSTALFVTDSVDQNILVTYTITDQNSCSASSQKSVTVHPLPILFLGQDTILCEGDVVTLSYFPSPDPLNLIWSTGSTGNTINVSMTGQYSLTAFNDFCTVSDSINIKFLPYPEITISVDTVCEGVPSLFAFSINALSNATYEWAMGDGQFYNQLPPSGTLSHLYADYGNFVTNLQVSNGYGCISEETLVAIVHHQPVSGFSAPPVCIGAASTVTFSGICETGNCVYEIFFGDGGQQIIPGVFTTINHTYQNADIYDLELVVSTPEGCTDTSSALHIVNPLPVADLGPDTSLISGEILVLSNAENPPQYQYTWSTGANTPTIEILNPGFYILWIEDSQTGCSDSDTILVDLRSVVAENKGILSALEISPNPAGQYVKVKLAAERPFAGTLSIFSSEGKEVVREPVSSEEPGNKWEGELSLTGLWPGVYQLSLDGIFLGRIIKIPD